MIIERLPNPIRYRGYYYDTESGLYYLQSRYYDPVVKRFINADQYASTGQGFIGYNMFAYCLNSAVTSVDIAGQLCARDAGVAGGAKRTEQAKVKAPQNKKKSSGTFTGGVNIAGAWGAGAYLSVGVAADTRGNIGLVFSGGGGGGTPSVSLSGYGTVTNAATIYDLAGHSLQVGGSFDAGIFVGAEYTLFPDSKKPGSYQGFTVLCGVGLPALPVPAELHGEIGTSYVVGINIVVALEDFWEWLNE